MITVQKVSTSYGCFSCREKIENYSNYSLIEHISGKFPFYIDTFFNSNTKIFQSIILCEKCTTAISGKKFLNYTFDYLPSFPLHCDICSNYSSFLYKFSLIFRGTSYPFARFIHKYFCEKCWLKFAGRNWLFDE